MKPFWVPIILLLSLALGSCGGSSQGVGEQSPDLDRLNQQEISTAESAADLLENPIQLASTPETTDMTLNPPSVDKFVQLAKRNLANLLTIGVDQISLIETVEITWPNVALGCPSPGKVYASGRVPGYRIKLGVNGIEYIYHMDQTGKYVLCPELNPDENIPSQPIIPGQTQSVDPGVP
jgi:hypothetical protein